MNTSIPAALTKKGYEGGQEWIKKKDTQRDSQNYACLLGLEVSISCVCIATKLQKEKRKTDTRFFLSLIAGLNTVDPILGGERPDTHFRGQ